MRITSKIMNGINPTIPKPVKVTEAGHPYLSPHEAMIKIFQGEKHWCTSNFLRGLFMIKILIASVLGIITSGFNVSPVTGSFIFVFTTLACIYLLVEVRLHIDVVQVFGLRRILYIKHLPATFLLYFVVYYFTRRVFKNIAEGKRSFLM